MIIWSQSVQLESWCWIDLDGPQRDQVPVSDHLVAQDGLAVQNKTANQLWLDKNPHQKSTISQCRKRIEWFLRPNSGKCMDSSIISATACPFFSPQNSPKSSKFRRFWRIKKIKKWKDDQKSHSLPPVNWRKVKKMSIFKKITKRTASSFAD